MTSISSATGSGASFTSGTGSSTPAQDFQAFLRMLTTQLQHQNPLEPLDTNQFTQQLVQFAQIEQQLRANQHLENLVTMQKGSQNSQALAYVGTTVAVDGASATLASGQATWKYTVAKPATATITITNSTGQTVYTTTMTVQAGEQKFTWDGNGNNKTKWTDGIYKISITAVDASKQTVAVSTEVEGVVQAVDLTKNPPVLTVNGQNFTVDQIKRVTKPAKA